MAAERRAKILLSGYYGFANAGDEAVLAALVQILRESLPGVEPVALSADPAQTAAAYGIRAIDRWDKAALKRELRDAALFASGGGSLLQDVTSVRSVYYYTSLLRAAQRAEVPTIVLAQGLGPLNKGLSRWLVRRALGGCRVLSWRDADSLDLARQIGAAQVKNLQVCDPVLLWRPEVTLDSKAGNTPGAGCRVALALRPWRDLPVDEAVRLAELLQQAGREVVLLPFHQGEDEKLAAEINSKLAHKAEIAACGTPELAVQALGRVDFVVGMRLHALILAAALGLPALAVSYDPKVTAFAGMMGIPLADGGTHFDAAQVCRQIDAGWGQPIDGRRAELLELWRPLLAEIGAIVGIEPQYDRLQQVLG